jgi:hypothetical protein
VKKSLSGQKVSVVLLLRLDDSLQVLLVCPLSVVAWPPKIYNVPFTFAAVFSSVSMALHVFELETYSCDSISYK